MLVFLSAPTRVASSHQPQREFSASDPARDWPVQNSIELPPSSVSQSSLLFLHLLFKQQQEERISTNFEGLPLEIRDMIFNEAATISRAQELLRCSLVNSTCNFPFLRLLRHSGTPQYVDVTDPSQSLMNLYANSPCGNHYSLSRLSLQGVSVTEADQEQGLISFFRCLKVTK